MIALPTTSLILCSRNRPRLLRDCVEAVLRGDEVPTELVIVDDSDEPGPISGDLDPTGRCEIRYRWRGESGLSSAVNLAIRMARFDVLVFLQDDVEPAPGWLGAIVRCLLAAGTRAVVTGLVEAGAAELPGAFAANETGPDKRAAFRGRLDRDVLYAQNMAINRSAYEEVGPFDERLGPGTAFPAAEDSDWGFRALEAGYTIVYEPTAVVRHRAWREPQHFVRFRWGYGVARGGFYAKHITSSERYMLRRLWWDVSRHVRDLPRLLRSDRRRAMGHIALTSGTLAGAARWLATRRRSVR